MAVAAIWAYWADPPLASPLVAAAVADRRVRVQVRRYRRVERRRRHSRGWPTSPTRRCSGSPVTGSSSRSGTRAAPSRPTRTPTTWTCWGAARCCTCWSRRVRASGRARCAWLRPRRRSPRRTASPFPAPRLMVSPSPGPGVGLSPSARPPSPSSRRSPSGARSWSGVVGPPAHPRPTPSRSWPGPRASRSWPRSEALVWGARISPPLFWILLLAQMGGLLAWPLWIVPILGNLLLGWQLVGTAVAPAEPGPLLRRGARRLRRRARSPGQQSFAAPSLQRVQAALNVEGQPPLPRSGASTRSFGWPSPATSMVYPSSKLTTPLERPRAERAGALAGPIRAGGPAAGSRRLARPRHWRRWLASRTTTRPGPCRTSILRPRGRGRGLGHPLLPAEDRVANDLTLGPTGTFLLVTGSNMSGKSTLLRAIGVNAVLAQAGGPVCATAFADCRRWSSGPRCGSRTRWSAASPSSWPRLERLKRSWTAAARCRRPEPQRRRAALYLLDEILQGTNTAERQIAARRVIRLLLVPERSGRSPPTT